MQTTKEQLHNALRQRLLSTSGDKLNVKADKNYVLTTVVDPRYKFWFLDNKETAKKWLLDKMQAAAVCVELIPKNCCGHGPNRTNGRQCRRTNSNTTKTLKEEIHDKFMKCYEDDHDLPYSSSDDERENYLMRNRLRQQGPSLIELVKEVDRYAVSLTIERSKNPLIFWKEERLHYPNIA